MNFITPPEIKEEKKKEIIIVNENIEQTSDKPVWKVFDKSHEDQNDSIKGIKRTNTMIGTRMNIVHNNN